MKINELLEKLQGQKKTNKRGNIFTIEELDFILAFLHNEYETSKISFRKLCKKYPFFTPEGLRRVWKNGYSHKERISKVRLDLFSSIKTEEDAYWLGFILADGYISDTNYFEISLKATDYKHLYKFATYAKYTGKIVNSQPIGDYFRCRLNTKLKDSIVNNFYKLGIVPRKSLILNFPNIALNLQPHLIRGYFDGDGCISESNEKWSLSFTGTLKVLTFINKFFNKNVKILSTKNSKIYSLAYGGNRQVKKFMDRIYKNSKVYLDRKYNIYCRLIEQSIR